MRFILLRALLRARTTIITITIITISREELPTLPQLRLGRTPLRVRGKRTA